MTGHRGSTTEKEGRGGVGAVGGLREEGFLLAVWKVAGEKKGKRVLSVSQGETEKGR